MIFYDTLEEMIEYYQEIAQNRPTSFTLQQLAYTRALTNISTCLDTSMTHTVAFCWRQVLLLRTWLETHEKGTDSYERKKWMESVYWLFLVRYSTISDDFNYAIEIEL